MLPPKKILFSVDYSAGSMKAVLFVNDLLAHFPAEFTLLHAYQIGSLVPGEVALPPTHLLEEATKKERNRLQSFAEDHFPDWPYELILSTEDVAHAIHSAIKSRGCDLLVTPTRGDLLGSVTSKVLRDADCAVWTATEAAMIAEKIPYRSVLCALGGPEESEAALRASLMIAETYRAQISIVHVIEPLDLAIEADLESLRRSLTDSANFEIRELQARLGVSLPHAVVEGPIPQTLREEALKNEAGLIVTGRGSIRSGLGRMWSHLYPIVCAAPCPVLSI